MKAIERVKQYIDYKGFTNSSFERKNSLSNGYITTQLKRNADLGEGVLIKILDNCLDLNPEWLLIGKGDMLNGVKSDKQKDQSVKQFEIDDIIISKNDLDTLNREYGYFPDIDIVKSYLTLSESRLKNILSSLKADIREKIATNNNIALIAEKLLVNRDSYYKHRFETITETEYMKKMIQDFDPSTTSFENVKLKWITLIYQFQSSNEDLAFLTANMTRYLKRAIDSGLNLGFLKVNEDLINKISDTE